MKIAKTDFSLSMTRGNHGEKETMHLQRGCLCVDFTSWRSFTKSVDGIESLVLYNQGVVIARIIGEEACLVACGIDEYLYI